MTTPASHIVHPLRILSATKTTTNPPLQSEVLQPKKDYQPRYENNIPSHIPPKSNKNTSIEIKTETLYFKLPTRQPSKPKGEAEKQAQVIIKLNRKLKDMLREAAFLTEILYQHNIQIPNHSELQQRLKKIDDKDIEDQYNKIKRKVPTPKTEKQHNCNSNQYQIHNPENYSQKSRKLQIKKSIDLKFIPINQQIPKSFNKDIPHSPNKQNPSHPTHNDHPHKENPINTNINTFQFQHQIQHQLKRAEHYKSKTNQLQIAYQQLITQNIQTEKINQDINNENIKLRLEILNYRHKEHKP